MSTQQNKQAGKTDTGSQVSSVITAGSVDGSMVGVQMDHLGEAVQITSVQDVGVVTGTLVGVQIGRPDECEQPSVAQEIDEVSGSQVGARIASLGDEPAVSQPASETPTGEPGGIVARARAWLARVFR